MTRNIVCVILAASMPLCQAREAEAVTWEGVFNGEFESGTHPRDDRPVHWLIGFPGDPAPERGSWRLAEDRESTSLELGTQQGENESSLAAQILDLPAAEMAGRTLAVQCRIRQLDAGAWVGIQVVGLNPEVPPDPENGVAHVGFLQLNATTTDVWQDVSGQLVLTGPAEMVVVVLFVIGDGSIDAHARFDDVSVTVDLPVPECGERHVEPLASGDPTFPFGLVNENPRNGSDRARADLVARAAEVGDLVNLFAHVRWNSLAGLPLLDGHGAVLDGADRAAEIGLERMLTLDFTHAELDGLGDINPWPDGTPVERLDAATRDAYVAELDALVEAVRPAIVSVGIETDFFLSLHREEWGEFRALVCESRERLRDRDAEIHITTYFTLETLVHPDLSANLEGQAAMRELRPCIDSVGFSYYPTDGVHHLEAVPPGMMTAAAAVAPELPLIVPEFGYRGGDEVYSEEEQEDFLRRALAELEGHPVVAAAWYSLYDQSYLGVEPFFQEAFRTIGLTRRDGTPKRALTMLARTRRMAGSQHPRPWCRPRPLVGGTRVGP